MRYVPAIVIALVVGAAVSFGVYVTKEPVVIAGLAGLVLAVAAIPRT